MNLRVSGRAQRETDRTDAWWRKNRPAVPDLFLRELVYVVELLMHSPTLGMAYEAEHLTNRPDRRLGDRPGNGGAEDAEATMRRWQASRVPIASASLWPCAAHSQGDIVSNQPGSDV